MPERNPGETISQFAVRTAWELGHFWNPIENPGGRNIAQSDLPLLKPEDEVVVKAMISMSKTDMTRYTKIVLEKHGRQPYFDGVIGLAMEAMVTDNTGRCPIPDFAPPPGVVFAFDDPDLQEVVLRMQRTSAEAIGSGGNWAGCHSIGNFHCAAMRVNPAGMNPRVAPLWKQVMTNVRKAYAGIGLLWKFIGMDDVDLLTGENFSGTIQTNLSFVSSSSGWIGLAIVTTNEGCGSTIWLKLLASYTGGNTDAAITNQITTLLAHEAGHNTGLPHTSGGTMNPSIQNGLPVGVWPESDPSTRTLRKMYGGEPVQIPGGGPLPPLPPNPPSTLEQRVLALEVKNIVNEVTIAWIVNKVKNLP